jgi:hypothetical protein
MFQPGEQATQINVVLNWVEELKQKVPASNRSRRYGTINASIAVPSAI